MIIYPAIDLRGGRCVRLQQGDLAAETVFADDPVDAARRWAAEGARGCTWSTWTARWATSASENLAALQRILAAVELPVQFGGGMRSLADVDRAARRWAWRA